ncbi:unnamed protein product [marine sediment metagenome]|uniref:Restriction alleviation protein, Lar family n=1 Tax=marine sediment metagenome TaxID=412755 RepID=X0UFG3_9ZZZZ
MNELKACPFCGTENPQECKGMGEFWVLCDECCGSSGLHNNRFKANDAWNRRVPTGDFIHAHDEVQRDKWAAIDRLITAEETK